MDLNVTIDDKSMDIGVIEKFLKEANLGIDYYDYVFSIQNGLFTGYSRFKTSCDEYSDYVVLDSSTNEQGNETVTITHSSIETLFSSKETYREETVCEFVFDGETYTRRDGKVSCSRDFGKEIPEAVSKLSSFQGIIDISFMGLNNVKVHNMHACRLDNGTLPSIDSLYGSKERPIQKTNNM